MRFKLLIITTICLGKFVFPQPELDIKPNTIEFEDLFNRFDYTYLINKGNAPLTIDSLSLNDDYYIVDFEDNQHLPFTINPEDTVRMNVTLSGFYYVTVLDTVDTIYVYNDGINSPGALKVKINFFEDEYGLVNGTVSDSLTPLENASIYFFYNGIYLLDTAFTDVSGHYQMTLPEGEYTITVEKEGYYVMFHDSTYDPYFAASVHVDTSIIQTVDFNMLRITDTTMSVSGEVIDSVTGIQFDKGLVIIRKGKHVPGNRMNENFISDTLYAFAGFIKPDGSYHVNVQIPGYYFVQAYSNYFLPGYYNDAGVASVFWQNSDSVLVDTTILDKNINLVRDSSYGGGSISGFITYPAQAIQQDFEGITLLIKSLDTGVLYSYNFGKQDGAYKVTNIPYGTYEVIGQKIGLDNGVSQTVTIDAINTQITGITVPFIISSVNDKITVPDKIQLYPNYPNPFNPETKIIFSLDKSEFVDLKIYNVLGQIVATLVQSELPAGLHEVIFNGTELSSGIYFYTLSAGEFTKTRKMILIK